ncbi:FAD-dependent monooxygenase [Legionella sp. D16C41]|uniref:FAD-dependent monooxygenase n=1 Tax=Legionella sp. D16C41 TaxID=3402688 RepID=UPI003AF59D4D
MASVIDVLIVGAGPTGLMLGLELARQKINFRIIDKKAQTSQVIKATALSSIALEGFDDFDYATPFIKVGNATQALVVYAEGKMAAHTPWSGIESKYPGYFLIGQNYIERFQEQLLNQLSAQVEWNTELKGLLEQGESIQANIQKSNQAELINCSYLIGCDGAHSLVQQQAQFAIDQGKKYPSHYLVADVALKGDFNPKHWYLFLAKNGFASVGSLPDNRWGILVSLPKTKTYEIGQQPTLLELQHYFDELSPIAGKLTNPRWLSHFHTYLQVIKNRRKGRVILCGDAAHQVSPLTSLGMNSGLMDARNLGWKLALQCQGFAADSLLDSYSVEQTQTLKSAKLLSDLNEKSFAMTGLISREYRDHVTGLMMRLAPVTRYFGGLLSQSTVRITKSSITAESIGLPFHRPFTSHQAQAEPDLQAWVNFGKGLSLGQRAPDVFAAKFTKTDTPQWLFKDGLAGKHGLFIFLANRPLWPEMTQAINVIMQNIEQSYGAWINLYLIVKEENYKSKFPYNVKVIFDEDNKIHKRYGASGACLYLIRPDRFIGFRSIPPRWDKLEIYLSKIFKLQ